MLRPESRLATSRSSSRRWPHLGPRRLLKSPCVRNQRKTAATKDLGNAGRVGTVWTRANRQQNPIDSPNNPQCVMDAPILGSSPFKIRPSEFLPAPLSPTTPFSPPCIPPKFVLHGLSSKSKFLAVTATPEYMLIGAIIPHPSGDVFLKMLGKEADLKKTKADFEKLIASAFEKAAK